MKKILVALGIAVLLSGLAYGDFITSSGYITNPTVVKFNMFGSYDNYGAGPITYATGPLTISTAPEIVWSSTGTQDLLGFGSFGFGENGYWVPSYDFSDWEPYGSWSFSDDERIDFGHMVLHSSGGSTMTFAFSDGPVAAVGGFMNYDYATSLGGHPHDNTILAAYDSDYNLLASYDLQTLAPILTPGYSTPREGTQFNYNAGRFRGIGFESAVISYFSISGTNVGFADLTFGGYDSSFVPPAEPPVVPVPEPATIGLAAFGFAMIAARKLLRQ